MGARERHPRLKRRAPRPVELEALPTGTWRAGLDRLLLGVTMSEDEQRLFAGVLPLDDVESGAIELAGRFAELLGAARVEPRRAGTGASRSPAGPRRSPARPTRWRPPRRARPERAELQRLLDDDSVTEAAGHTTALALPEVRDLLAERLRGRPTRANFRTGHLTCMLSDALGVYWFGACSAPWTACSPARARATATT